MDEVELKQRLEIIITSPAFSPLLDPIFEKQRDAILDLIKEYIKEYLSTIQLFPLDSNYNQHIPPQRLNIVNDSNEYI